MTQTGIPLPGAWRWRRPHPQAGGRPYLRVWPSGGDLPPPTPITRPGSEPRLLWTRFAEPLTVPVPVGISRTPAFDPQLSLAPRGSARSEHLQMSHRASPEVIVETGQQRWRQQPDLSGPCGRVGAHGEASGVELFWRAVCRQLESRRFVAIGLRRHRWRAAATTPARPPARQQRHRSVGGRDRLDRTGVPVAGPLPAERCRRRILRRPRPLLLEVPCAARACARSWLARSGPLVGRCVHPSLVTSRVPARSGGCCRSLSGVTCHLPGVNGKPDAGQRRRNVIGHRRRHDHLLGTDHHIGQAVPARGVELCEHVIEDQHRVIAVGAQQPNDANRSASTIDQDSPCEA